MLATKIKEKTYDTGDTIKIKTKDNFFGQLKVKKKTFPQKSENFYASRNTFPKHAHTHAFSLHKLFTLDKTFFPVPSIPSLID